MSVRIYFNLQLIRRHLLDTDTLKVNAVTIRYFDKLRTPSATPEIDPNIKTISILDTLMESDMNRAQQYHYA